MGYRVEWRRRNDDLGVAMLKGAVAGAVATWAMGQVTTYLYEHESERAREVEDEARGQKTAYGVAAEKLARAGGRELSDDERARFGSALHWLLGAGAGAAYAVLRHRIPYVDRGNGLAFGATFFALVDEGATVALGLTPGPLAFPWQTHARGLAGHLVFGVAADTMLRALDQVA
jgi:hypothetical protein